MGFFDAFQQWAGENRANRLRPIAQMKNEVQLELERRQAIARQLQEQSFRDIAGELEKQRARAESVAQNPDQKLSVTEQVPSWNEADQLALYDAYQRSGIDRKKQADSDQAVLAADAFKRGLANITNEAALVNIGMGKEYKPVELEGGVFYNPYDTQNFNLGSTQKHQAETKLEQSKAVEQALRLANIELLKDPLMQINATSNKELGKPVEVIIEGENGESNIVLASQDSSGKYRPQVLADTASGKPLVIPPESVGEGLTSEQKNIKNRAKVWGISEAEALASMNVKSQYSDIGFIESRLIANSKGPFGRRNSDKIIIEATFDDFVRARNGSYFPEHFIDEANRSEDMTAIEKEAFKKKVEDHNQQVFEQQLAGKAQEVAPDTVIETRNEVPSVSTVQGTPAQQGRALYNLGNIQFPKPELPNLQLTPSTAGQPLQAGMTMGQNNMPAVTPENLAAPPTTQPIPESQRGPDFQTILTQSILTNNGPDQINAALKKQGINPSPENMIAMAIDAVNRGENPADMQQLLMLLGIQWTPPA